MKRQGNDRQLRPDELEALEDEVEDSGVFSRADSNILSTRKIIKVKRPDKKEEDSSKLFSNPFANVNLINSVPSNLSSNQTSNNPKSNFSNPETSNDDTIFKNKMKRLNDNFLLFMEKNPNSIWKEGLEVYSISILYYTIFLI